MGAGLPQVVPSVLHCEEFCLGTRWRRGCSLCKNPKSRLWWMNQFAPDPNPYSPQLLSISMLEDQAPRTGTLEYQITSSRDGLCLTSEYSLSKQLLRNKGGGGEFRYQTLTSSSDRHLTQNMAWSSRTIVFKEHSRWPWGLSLLKRCSSIGYRTQETSSWRMESRICEI